MDKTLIVGSPNISGNVGSCEIKSNEFSVSMFKSQTVAVNSCTGEIVASNIFISSDFIFYGIVIILIILFIWVINKN